MLLMRVLHAAACRGACCSAAPFANAESHTVTHANCRERREALASQARGASGTGGLEELPDRFWKLPRIKFLLLLCKEVARVNR